MATNKNAQIRYKALDDCFRNKYKKYFIEDLIDHCSVILSDYYCQEISVSRRQVFDDMSFMESSAGFNMSINKHKDGRRIYYRYEDTNVSILKKEMSKYEEELLNEAMQTLNRLNNISGFDWVHALNAKINASLNLQNNERQVMSFEENAFLKGSEYLNPLYQYIINKQTLSISYQSFKREVPEDITVSPYYLKQYNNRWFLFGWNNKLTLLQNLAVDRILSFQAKKDKYTPCKIDFENYFDEIIGVSNDLNAQVETIKIELSQNILPYIQSKPVHGTQKIKDNILTIEVKVNYELQSLILSYGENMKVLEPKPFKDKVKTIVKELSQRYS